MRSQVRALSSLPQAISVSGSTSDSKSESRGSIPLWSAKNVCDGGRVVRRWFAKPFMVVRFHPITPKIILDKSGNLCYSIYMMRKDSIKKHFHVFLKSAAWSKDWKPKSRESLPSSLFSAHYFEKYPQAKKYFPHVK